MSSIKGDAIIDSNKLNTALQDALDIAKRNIVKFQDKFPKESTRTGLYGYCDDEEHWLGGFWVGIFWLCYEISGDTKIRCYAESLSEKLYENFYEKNILHSDLGIMYILSCVANYRLTKNEEARAAAVMAAGCQLRFYNPSSKLVCTYIEEIDEKTGTCKLTDILNMLLLYFAEKVTGNSAYANVAREQIDFILKNHITDSGEVFFRYGFSIEDGKPLHEIEEYKDGVLLNGMARHYAWALLGLAIQHSITKKREIALLFEKVFNYLFSKISGDICGFKLQNGNGEVQLPDTTSTAIVVCGILEMIKNMSDSSPQKKMYEEKASTLLNLLIDNYAVLPKMGYEGLLLQGKWSYKDVLSNCCTVCGDYFYLEALIRCYKDWKPYWY